VVGGVYGAGSEESGFGLGNDPVFCSKAMDLDWTGAGRDFLRYGDKTACCGLRSLQPDVEVVLICLAFAVANAFGF
jgi:hypothetical protein